MYHDVLTYPPEGDEYAISDPTIACMKSMHAAADGVPTVIVVRAPEEAFKALEAALGARLEKPFLERLEADFRAFCAPTRRAMYVSAGVLDSPEVIQAISLYLTGKEQSERRINTFQALNITEDFERAYRRTAYPKLGVVH